MEDSESATPLEEGVASAVALGWNVSELSVLLASPELGDAEPVRFDDDPSGSGYREQLVMRVDARVTKLQSAVRVEALKESLGHAKERFVEEVSADSLARLHTRVASVLLAEDSRLGKSYRLGMTLHQLCARSESGSGGWYDQERVDRAMRYLAELQTVLPDHAAMGVLGSLKMWAHFAPATTWDHPHMELEHQGRVWRALLSGEKAAVQDLVLSDYVYAAKRAVWYAGQVFGRVLGSAFGGVGRAAVLGALVLLLVVAGLMILAFNDTQGALGGGALALVSGTGVVGFFKKLGDGVEGVWDTAKPALMGAAIDTAVAVAITQLPVHQKNETLRDRINKEVHPTGFAFGSAR